MAKTLLLMRHGKSSWKDKDIPDLKRPLKKRGAAASAQIGEVLQETNLSRMDDSFPPLHYGPAKRPKSSLK